MARPPSSLHDLPVWARAIAVVGFPCVAAAYLIWLLGNALPEKLEAHARAMDAHTVESRDLATRQIQLLSQICANTAKTDDEKAACWRAQQ